MYLTNILHNSLFCFSCFQSYCAIRKLYGRCLCDSCFLNTRIINVTFIKINAVSLPLKISLHIKKQDNDYIK